ncbi:MAG: transketolase [Proteobacteria bacterium]|nr:transketolase [Pseudomonadota bacterium]
MNRKLRKRIVDVITKAGEGHIPSSFSVVDIISVLYKKHLKVDPKNPRWVDRDYFVLSKGHAGVALFVVLRECGFITEDQLHSYGGFDSILGGHPDSTKVPGAEASTGSLGHGFPFAVGIALGLKVQKKTNRVFVLVGDGECHEGTIWEAALVAQNMGLDNLCCIVDLNGSAAQILPHPNLAGQWEAFGWQVLCVAGHDENALDAVLSEAREIQTQKAGPVCIVADTVKGKGVSFLETHGPWHHKIPNQEEYEAIIKELIQ